MSYFFREARRLHRRLTSREPFGKTPWGSRATYVSLFKAAGGQKHPEVDDFVSESGHSVDSDWIDYLALHTQVTMKKSPLDWNHGRVLYSALRTRLTAQDPGGCLVFESGTARGFSGVVMSRALLDANVPGMVVSIDVLPHTTPMIWNCLKDNDGPQSREMLLNEWPEECARIIFVEQESSRFTSTISLPRISFAFLDGQHDHATVMREFRYVEARQKTADVVVFDDVTPGKFNGICRVVETVVHESRYEVRRIISSSLRGYAVCTRI